MKAKWTATVCGILLILLGGMVITGWILHIPRMVQLNPNWVGMVVNSALLFILIGIYLILLNNLIAPRLQQIICLVILILAGLSFVQDLLKIDLGVDRLFITPWLDDPNPVPGRMAPNTAFAFILVGLTGLLMKSRAHFTLISIQILTYLVFMIALIGILVYSLRLEYIFSWYGYTRMALHTALGFILVGIGLWCSWRQSTWYQAFYDKEEKKILLVLAATLITLTLISGVGSIAALTYHHIDFILKAFQSTLQSKIEVINSELSAIKKNIILAKQNTLLINALEHKKVNQLQMNLYLNSTFDEKSFLSITNLQGQTIFQKGKPLRPEMQVAIYFPFVAKILWQQGFWLQFKTPIYKPRSKQLLGFFSGEVPLEQMTQVYSDISQLGETGEIVICKKIAENAYCFPTVYSKHPFQFALNKPDSPLPMKYALAGKNGTVNALDYRKKRIIAAYSQIDNTGLGIVNKVDALTIYKPIHNQLITILPYVLLLIFAGLGLLRWQLLPIIKKMVDAKKEAEENRLKLQKSEERYEISARSSQTGLWDWDLQKNQIHYTNEIRTLLGYTEEELPNTSYALDSLIHPEDLTRVRETVKAHLQHHLPYNTEYRILKKNGQYGWFQAIGQASWDNENHPLRMSGSLIDITERKKIDTLKNEFISVVSHELRTPLTSIRGSLCLILGGTVGDFSQKAKKLLDIANKNCERLINLINDILDIEKIEAGKIKLNFVRLELNQLIKESIAENEMYAAKFHVTLAFQPKTQAFYVYADRDRLMQVLANLLSNAIKFSKENSTVAIAINQYDTLIRVSVTNKGAEIPEEFKKRIFSKFSQADSSTTRTLGGTGLGLSISKAIIEKLGGSINFKSDANETVFYFDLPEIQNKKNTPISDTRQQKQILICEDEEFQAKHLALLLESAGYTSDIAYTAAETKKLLQERDYEALLLDLILPDEDGITLIREIRQNEKTRFLPIIVLSVIADEGPTLLNGDAFTIIDWLAKPIDFNRLLADIAFIKKTERPLILHIEDDLDNQQIVENLLKDKCDIINTGTILESKIILSKERFDLVILDLTLPDGNSALLIPLLAQQKIPIIIFSASELDPSYSQYVKEAFVKSKTSNEDLIESVKKLLAGLNKENL